MNRSVGVGILLLTLSCAARSEQWTCANDFQAQCDQGGCEIQTGQAFTPLSVSLNSAGEFSVCAYSGCWDGSGRVVSQSPFLVIVGRDVPWSDPASPNPVDAMLSLNLASGIAVVQAGAFHQPVLCKSGQPGPWRAAR